MSAPNVILQLDKVTKAYGDHSANALGPLSLQVISGEFTVIVGPSGCGKTTLLRLIAGLERPDAGTIILNGNPVASFSKWVAPEERPIGMVFQDYSLFPHLTVERNIYFGLKKKNLDSKQIQHIENLFDLLGLKTLRSRYPHELSGGEQQRVAVARALAHQPALILFDEPFSNLDAHLRPRMRRELKKLLRELKSTALFVTHDQTEAIELADRMAVLRAGQLEQLDTPELIYRCPATRFVAKFVGEADFIRGLLQPNLLETELGNFAIRTSTKLATQEVDVMVDPRSLELTPLSGNISSEKQAQIVLRQFRGAEILYALRLPSGQELRAITIASRSFSEGEFVQVKLSSLPAIYYQNKRFDLV